MIPWCLSQGKVPHSIPQTNGIGDANTLSHELLFRGNRLPYPTLHSSGVSTIFLRLSSCSYFRFTYKKHEVLLHESLCFCAQFSFRDTKKAQRNQEGAKWVVQGIEWVSGIANYFSNIINWAQWYRVHPSVNIPVHQLRHSSCYHVLLKEVRGWYVCNLESYVFYNVNILWGNRNITLKM